MGIAEIYRLYGMTYSMVQEWDSAEKALYKGIEICDEYENHLTAAEIYYELGTIKRKQKENEEALEHLNKAIEIYEILEINNEVEKIKAEVLLIAA